MSRPKLLALLVLAPLAVGGCTFKNVPLNAPDVPLEHRVLNRTRADTQASVRPETGQPQADPSKPQPRAGGGPGNGHFVGIAISGGGSRSANFAAATMFQLQRLGLLGHVDYISSVSGGSLTAAYYCLSGDDAWNPGNVQRKLQHSFATDSIVRFLMPWNWIAMLISDYDRSDLLAENFEKVLFSRGGRALTFADLRADRPRLLINATDLQSGHKFIFCDATFDDMNSDLSRYPIAWAVAASSSVPVILHQVTLRDFSTVFEQYRHFIDGGIADNLGVQSLVEVYEAQNAAAAARGEPAPYPKGAIFFVIDARTNYNAKLSDKGDTSILESLEMAGGLSSTNLLNRASTATLSELIVRYSAANTSADALRKQIDGLEKTGFLETQDQRQRPVRIVHFALQHVTELGNLPFQNFSESLDNIATYFNISRSDAHDLYQAAELLMREKYEPLLTPLVRELDGKPPATVPASP